MNAPTTVSMTIEQFHAWLDARAATLPYDEPKWELFDGVPEMQESERWAHARTKVMIYLALHDAIRSAGLSLEVGIDGIGVRIGRKEKYVPEVVVFPAGIIGDDDRDAPDPVVVVEVLSSSTMAKDLKVKAAGYGRVPTIQHYLVVDPDAREVLHFEREGKRLIAPARPLSSGILRLDQPGFEVRVEDMFEQHLKSD